jgi:hypothetical protein
MDNEIKEEKVNSISPEIDEIYPRFPMRDEIKILSVIDDALKWAENDRPNAIVRQLKVEGYDIVPVDKNLSPNGELVVDLRFTISPEELRPEPPEVLAEYLRGTVTDTFRGQVKTVEVLQSVGGPYVKE